MIRPVCLLAILCLCLGCSDSPTSNSDSQVDTDVIGTNNEWDIVRSRMSKLTSEMSHDQIIDTLGIPRDRMDERSGFSTGMWTQITFDKGAGLIGVNRLGREADSITLLTPNSPVPKTVNFGVFARSGLFQGGGFQGGFPEILHE